MSAESAIAVLLQNLLGTGPCRNIFDALEIDPALMAERGPVVSRAAFAMAMNAALFHGLLDRAPSGAAYVADRVARGDRIIFDHGALRTVQLPHGPTGELPPGEDAFTRILLPLGYEMAGVYPLDRLRMTGRAYRHAGMPEAIPQFFLSELHVDRFDPEFGEVAARVFGTSRDPLTPEAQHVLAKYAERKAVSLDEAIQALPAIVAAFDRQHEPVHIADYELLLSRSHEAGWIATEGNAFNHATDRVTDVAALAERLKTEDWPMKERLEVSRSGRVRQTAFRADTVERLFANHVLRMVPGSFYEFISRDIDPATGRIDLAFDTGNATGIFAMTSAR